MKLENISKFFYQGNSVFNVQLHNQTCSLLYASDMPLAQTHTALGTGLLATDSGGSILRMEGDEGEVYVFDPYGHNALFASARSVLGFNGQRFDRYSESYILGNGFRPFSPTDKRFRSTDNLSPFKEGGRNTYSYCSGDPINNLDPSGHKLLGKSYNQAETLAFNSISRKPLPGRRTKSIELSKANKDLNLLNKRIAENDKKLLNYSVNNPGKLLEAHEATIALAGKKATSASGHWSSKAAFRAHQELRLGEGSVTHLYNSNPGLKENYSLYLETRQLEQNANNLSRQITALRQELYPEKP